MTLRLLRRAIPLLVALLLLGSHFAVALHACNLAAMPMPNSSDMPEMSDCMKQMDSVQEPLLCKLHCDQDAQSSQTAFPHLALPIMAFVLMGMLALLWAAPYLVRSNFPVGALISSSPPLRLQYQTFRN